MAVHARTTQRTRTDALATLSVDPGSPIEDCVAAGTADLSAHRGMVLGRPPAWRGIADDAASFDLSFGHDRYAILQSGRIHPRYDRKCLEPRLS